MGEGVVGHGFLPSGGGRDVGASGKCLRPKATGEALMHIGAVRSRPCECLRMKKVSE